MLVSIDLDDSHLSGLSDLAGSESDENTNAHSSDNDSLDDSCDPPLTKQPSISSPQCGDVAHFLGVRISIEC